MQVKPEKYEHFSYYSQLSRELDEPIHGRRQLGFDSRIVLGAAAASFALALLYVVIQL